MNMSDNQAIFHESLYDSNQTLIPFQLRDGMTVWDFLKESGVWDKMQEMPIVVKLNGQELVEEQYCSLLKASDTIELQQYPRGPAVVAVIYWVSVAFVVISAIYIMTMPEPGLPQTADIKEGSPTYSLNAKGNRYRPERKGPILYGTLRIVPDFDQPPFSTYDANNDQTLHMIFRITQGQASVDTASITFEDTPLSNFQGVTLEVIQPGQVPTIFPAGVIESNDINNLELLDPATAAYVVNPINTKVNKIAIDLTAPGLYDQDKSTGALKAYSVSVLVQAQRLQAATNTPVGSWVNLGTVTLSGDSRDALRRTFEFPVTADRYQVRLDRTTAKNVSQYVQDDVSWAGLKGYLFDEDNVSPNTRLAIAIRASQQIGNRSLSDMSVICSRKLDVWDVSNGWGPAPILTNSIGWALADLCRAVYAGNRSDFNYDLLALAELDAQLTPAGHEFNAYFDTENVSVWEALIKAGTPGRITPIDHAGFYKFVRDELKPVAVQAFMMRNILRNSFSIEHKGVLEETADCILVEFQDEDNDYRVRELLCKLPDSPALRPRKINLFGVTNATRAKELGMFMAAANRYRRKLTPFGAGIEGRIPFYGDRIAISHVMLGKEGTRQISGDIVAYDGVDVIRISEKIPTGYLTTPYIVVIDLQGQPLPPCEVTILDNQTLRLIDFDYWSEIQFSPNYKKTPFILGDGQTFVTYSKVLSITRDGSSIKFEAFVDDDRVYTYGDDVIPPDPVVIPPPQTAAPVLTNLLAHVGGSITEPVVTLTWSTKNADKTEIQYSTDGGVNYVGIGPGYTYENRFQHSPQPGVITYRLAAVNLFRGPWIAITVDTSSAAFNPPLDPTNLRLRESFVGPVLKVQWDSDSYRHIIQIRKAGVLIHTVTMEGTVWDLDGKDAQVFGAGRSFTVRVYAVGDNGKTSTGYTELAVTNPAPAILNNLSVVSFYGIASVTFDFPVVSDLEGISVWKSPTTGFSPSAATLAVDKTMDPVIGVPLDEDEVAYIRIAAVDVWGIEGLNFSGQYTVTGKGIDLTPVYEDLAELQEDLTNLTEELNDAETDIANAIIDINSLEGKFPIGTTDISDNAISTPKLQANSVTAAKIVALAITADKIAALTITGDKIAALTISGDKIIANTIGADKIVANSITGDKIAALTITAGNIAAGTITTDKLNVAQLSAITADMGTLTAGLIKTTSSSSVARLEIDSNGSFPLWIGANGKDASNGQVFYDKTAQNFVIRDPNTGRRFEFQPSSSMPIWFGSGTKAAANGNFYWDTALNRLVIRNIQAESGYITELQSNNWVNNTTGFKLFADGSAQFNNLVISRPNVVASGTLNIGTATAATAHFGNFNNPVYTLGSTFFASRYNQPIYAQDPVDNYWYEQRPAGAGFGWEGYYEFRVDIPTSTFNPDEVGVVNGRMLTAQAVVVNSEYWHTGGTPSYGYVAPCTALVTRVANYGASGSYIQIRIQVPVPFDKHPSITAIQIRSINWALSAYT